MYLIHFITSFLIISHYKSWDNIGIILVLILSDIISNNENLYFSKAHKNTVLKGIKNLGNK